MAIPVPYQKCLYKPNKYKKSLVERTREHITGTLLEIV